ncbi:nucleoside 2-deoxyribosyltransferase [Sulfurospirillum arcachonense]|uniref:nucleoside 2-deoxyribosyltransferase n=1 Tax=Sulfurospirillum arcachonense TaxID=57666 RepID=UPI0004695808|nr:nucleoside 2-deoxyribosyltransferase [Sulfurospirillum arcachonense]
MKKIYIAGFDVFKPDSLEIGKKYKLTCKEFGYEGLYPLDNQIDESWSKEVARDFIYKKNIELIEKSDLVVANGNPFRGDELDSGTAFEIGYAIALKKQVVIYMEDTRDYKQKCTCKDENRDNVDKNGMFIEDFNYPLNLMFLDCNIVQGGFQEAIHFLKNK